jgi:hypothetical protein
LAHTKHQQKQQKHLIMQQWKPNDQFHILIFLIYYPSRLK